MDSPLRRDIIGDMGMLLKDGTKARFNIVDLVQRGDGNVLYVIDEEGYKIPWDAIIYFKKFEEETNNG